MYVLSRSVMSDSLGPHGPSLPNSFFQGIFPTQGSNPSLLHWQADSLPSEPQGSPNTKLHVCKSWIKNTESLLSVISFFPTWFYILCWRWVVFFFFPHVSTSWFTGKNAVSTLFVGYRNARWQAFPQCLWCVLIISCHTKCIYNMDFKNWPQDMGVLHRKLNRTAWLLNLKYSFICSFICSIIQKKHSCRHCTKTGKLDPALIKYPVCQWNPLEISVCCGGGGGRTEFI